MPSKHLGLPLVNEPMTIMFSSDGGVKEIEEFDISLYAPPGVVQRDQNLILNIGLCFYGPFSIPDKYLVATGFYYITANTRLRKGLEITMGHCLQMAVYERSNQVVVLRGEAGQSQILALHTHTHTHTHIHTHTQNTSTHADTSFTRAWPCCVRRDCTAVKCSSLWCVEIKILH